MSICELKNRRRKNNYRDVATRTTMLIASLLSLSVSGVRKTKAEILSPLVPMKSGWFIFGSQEFESEGFQAALKKAKEEKFREEDMKDEVGDETYDLIQEQLNAHRKSKGKDPLEKEKKLPQTRDGGGEPDVGSRVRGTPPRRVSVAR